MAEGATSRGGRQHREVPGDHTYTERELLLAPRHTISYADIRLISRFSGHHPVTQCLIPQSYALVLHDHTILLHLLRIRLVSTPTFQMLRSLPQKVSRLMHAHSRVRDFAQRLSDCDVVRLARMIVERNGAFVVIDGVLLALRYYQMSVPQCRISRYG